MSGKNSDSGQERRGSTRRTFFKTGIATVGAIAGTGLVTGDSGSNSTNVSRADRNHENALRIRDETGSQEKFKRYLEDTADYFASKKMSFTPSSMEEEGPSTQSWSESKIQTDLVLTHYHCPMSDTVAYFDYYIEVDGTYGGGEGGPDQNSISWADHHYRYQQGSAYSDSSMDNLHLKQESINGVDWEWEDGKSCYWSCGTKDWYVGCKADLLSTSQERAVQASYWDMWSQATVESVSFSSSGAVSFTFSEEGRTDQYGYQITEESDAEQSECM